MLSLSVERIRSRATLKGFRQTSERGDYREYVDNVLSYRIVNLLMNDHLNFIQQFSSPAQPLALGGHPVYTACEPPLLRGILFSHSVHIFSNCELLYLSLFVQLIQLSALGNRTLRYVSVCRTMTEQHLGAGTVVIPVHPQYAFPRICTLIREEVDVTHCLAFAGEVSLSSNESHLVELVLCEAEPRGRDPAVEICQEMEWEAGSGKKRAKPAKIRFTALINVRRTVI